MAEKECEYCLKPIGEFNGKFELSGELLRCTMATIKIHVDTPLCKNCFAALVLTVTQRPMEYGGLKPDIDKMVNDAHVLTIGSDGD